MATTTTTTAITTTPFSLSCSVEGGSTSFRFFLFFCLFLILELEPDGKVPSIHSLKGLWYVFMGAALLVVIIFPCCTWRRLLLRYRS